MRARSSRTRKGLGTKSDAPSPSVRTAASSGGIAEIMSTGRSRYRSSPRMRSSTSNPSRSGIMMSSRSRSGTEISSSSSSSRDPGTAITSYPCSLRIQETVLSSASSSSTTRMRGLTSAEEVTQPRPLDVAAAQHAHRLTAGAHRAGLKRREGDRPTRLSDDLHAIEQPAHRVDEGDHLRGASEDRKSTRLNSSHGYISYAVFCLKKKNK